jgi:acetyl esterase/lipase
MPTKKAAYSLGFGLFMAALPISCPSLPSLPRQAGPAIDTVRDVTYVERADGPLKADIYQPKGDGPFPAVLVVHGGAWMSGDKGQLAAVAEQLAGKGFVAVAIGYRLAPKHKFPAQIDDCREAVAWMQKNAQKYKIDPGRLAAWGYSAGGHLAALLAVTDAPLKAAVAGGAPCDFRDLPPDNVMLSFWLGDSRSKSPEVYKKASPAEYVTPKCPPIFFYHGEKDAMVPIEQPKAMTEALKKEKVPVEFYTVKGDGHIETFFNKDARDEGVKFLEKYLGSRGEEQGAREEGLGARD